MATIYYNIDTGTPPFTASINPAVAGDNIHNSTGSFYFTNIPDGEYVISIVDNVGCQAVFDAVVYCDSTTTTTTELPPPEIQPGTHVYVCQALGQECVAENYPYTVHVPYPLIIGALMFEPNRTWDEIEYIEIVSSSSVDGLVIKYNGSLVYPGLILYPASDVTWQYLMETIRSEMECNSLYETWYIRVKLYGYQISESVRFSVGYSQQVCTCETTTTTTLEPTTTTTTLEVTTTTSSTTVEPTTTTTTTGEPIELLTYEYAITKTQSGWNLLSYPFTDPTSHLTAQELVVPMLEPPYEDTSLVEYFEVITYSTDHADHHIIYNGVEIQNGDKLYNNGTDNFEHGELKYREDSAPTGSRSASILMRVQFLSGQTSTNNTLTYRVRILDETTTTTTTIE